jgi:hypothetical protein
MQRGETPEKLREAISPAPDTDPKIQKFRFAVLELFDSFVLAGRVIRASAAPKKHIQHHSTRPHRSSFDQAGIVRCIKRGELRAEIAKTFHCSTASVSKIARAHGLHCKKAALRRAPSFSPEQVSQANEALACGASTTNVAERFGVSKMTILRRCKTFKPIRDGALSRYQVRKARELLSDGMRLADCATRFRVCTSTLTRYGLRAKRKWNLIEAKNRRLDDGPRINKWRGWSIVYGKGI